MKCEPHKIEECFNFITFRISPYKDVRSSKETTAWKLRNLILTVDWNYWSLNIYFITWIFRFPIFVQANIFLWLVKGSVSLRNHNIPSDCNKYPHPPCCYVDKCSVTVIPNDYSYISCSAPRKHSRLLQGTVFSNNFTQFA